MEQSRKGFITLHTNVFFYLYLCVALCMGLAPAAFAKGAASNPRYAALVVNAETGNVLHQENADKYRYPASLTKMMTLYLTFEAIKQGRLHMDDIITVSAFAASQPRMNMGFRKGQKISVREAILSLIVRSANDSAVALAEEVGGSESAFADKMTLRAKQLGMAHTIFRNASGLPNSEQKTTAYDLARLAIALRRDYPEYYPLFSRTSFTYQGRTYQGHNRLTSNYPGCDGLKTGFVNASGFNLVSSVVRGDTKLVAVVMGGETARSRDAQMVKLLDRFLGKSASNEEIATAKEATPIHKVSKKQRLKIKSYKQVANNDKHKGKKAKTYSTAQKKSKKRSQEVAGL